MSDYNHCPLCGTDLDPPAIHGRDRLHGTPGRYSVAVCRSCGAGVTLPPVDDDLLSEFYPADYGPYDDRMNAIVRLASRSVRGFQGWNALRNDPLRVLRGRCAGRGLDVGCGRGDFAALLARRGWAMTGVEPSPAACAVAAKRGIEVRCGTLSTVPLEADSYDAVIFRHSLEHTNEPASTLSKVSAALKPGGLALISVPNFASWQARRFASCWYHLDLPRHRVHFTPDALLRALTDAGLDAVSVSTSSSSIGLMASIQYRTVGHCLFPGGLKLRVAAGVCALSLPLIVALDRGGGAGDTLHAVARRPATARSISSASATAGAG